MNRKQMGNALIYTFTVITTAATLTQSVMVLMEAHKRMNAWVNKPKLSPVRKIY